MRKTSFIFFVRPIVDLYIFGKRRSFLCFVVFCCCVCLLFVVCLTLFTETAPFGAEGAISLTKTTIVNLRGDGLLASY